MSFLGGFYSSTNDASFSNPEPKGQDASTWSKYPATENVDMDNFNLDNLNNATINGTLDANQILVTDLFATNITAVNKDVLDLNVQNNATINGTLDANLLIVNGDSEFLDTMRTEAILANGSVICTGFQLATNRLSVANNFEYTSGSPANITSINTNQLNFNPLGSIKGQSIPVAGGNQGAFLTTGSPTNGIWIMPIARWSLSVPSGSNGIIASNKAYSSVAHIHITGSTTANATIQFEQRIGNEPTTIHELFIYQDNILGGANTTFTLEYTDLSGNVIPSLPGGGDTILVGSRGGGAFTTHAGTYDLIVPPSTFQHVTVFVNNIDTKAYPVLITI